MNHYTLTDFFQDYIFRGTIGYPKDKSNFDLEVFKYDPISGLFLASGLDNRGLSGIIGTIKQDTETLARMRFKQTFDMKKFFNFDAIIKKEPGDIFLTGDYKHPANHHIYSLNLALALRGKSITSIGWMDKALGVEFC